VFNALDKKRLRLHQSVLQGPAHNRIVVQATGADQIRQCHEHVASGEEDDWSLRVAETRGLNEECENCEEGGAEAQRRPDKHPEASEVDLGAVEDVVVAGHAAVGDYLFVDCEVVGVLVVAGDLEGWWTGEFDAHVGSCCSSGCGCCCIQLEVVGLTVVVEKVSVGLSSF